MYYKREVILFCLFLCWFLCFRFFQVNLAGIVQQVVPQQNFLYVTGVNMFGVIVWQHLFKIGEEVGISCFSNVEGDSFAILFTEDVLHDFSEGFLFSVVKILISFNELILSVLNTGQRFLSARDSTIAPVFVCDTSS